MPLNKVLVERLEKPVAEQPIEITERKGRGHPDSICDAVAERACQALCREYLKEFGAIPHFNLDKGMLAAGRTQPEFGGGRVLQPMRLVLGDRATFSVGRKSVDAAAIACDAAMQWLRERLRFVDCSKHVKCEAVLEEGAAALTDLFARKRVGANDSSAAVGYAPLSATDELVLAVEQHANSPEFKHAFPWTGEDTKVLAVRKSSKIDVTIAMPFVDRFIESEEDYFKKKAEVEQELKQFTHSFAEARGLQAKLFFNALDRRGRGIAGLYLTVLGTSAEHGDSGEVGRGNRVNGVIPLSRPVTSEAAAGKNPVSHSGKIYSFLSHELARKIVEEVEGVAEAYVWLASRIGEPLNKPAFAGVQLCVERGDFNAAARRARQAVEEALEDLPAFTKRLAAGKYRVP